MECECCSSFCDRFPLPNRLIPVDTADLHAQPQRESESPERCSYQQCGLCVDRSTLVASGGAGSCGAAGCAKGVCCGAETLRIVLMAVPFTVLIYSWLIAAVGWVIFVFRMRASCGGRSSGGGGGGGGDRVSSSINDNGAGSYPAGEAVLSVPTVIDMPPDCIESESAAPPSNSGGIESAELVPTRAQ